MPVPWDLGAFFEEYLISQRHGLPTQGSITVLVEEAAVVADTPVASSRDMELVFSSVTRLIRMGSSGPSGSVDKVR